MQKPCMGGKCLEELLRYGFIRVVVTSLASRPKRMVKRGWFVFKDFNNLITGFISELIDSVVSHFHILVFHWPPRLE